MKGRRHIPKSFSVITVRKYPADAAGHSQKEDWDRLALLAQRLIHNPAIRELGRLATRAGALCAANGQLVAWATLARSASAQRKLDKQFTQNTFEFVAMEGIERQKTKWSSSYAETIYRRLKRNLFPFIGSRPVNGITAPELLALLSESRGTRHQRHGAHAQKSLFLHHALCHCHRPRGR